MGIELTSIFCPLFRGFAAGLLAQLALSLSTWLRDYLYILWAATGTAMEDVPQPV
jgi:hypothetical protein